MKSFMILCSVVAVAYAGVGQLSPDEEAQILNMFSRVCAGGSGGGDIGGYTVYCKLSNGEISETRNHQVVVPGSQGQGQVVFVQPPPVRYLHNVQVIGSNSQAGQTKIYVLPQKSDHQIIPQVQPGSQSQSKPTVYFLKNGGGSSGSATSNGGGYGAPQPQPQIISTAQYNPQQGYN